MASYDKGDIREQEECIMVVGLENFIQDLESLDQQREAYRRYGFALPNYVICLEKGNGQTFLTNHLTDYLESHHLRTFHSLDRCLEYQLTGDYQQMEITMNDIDDRAVYVNRFDGVVSVDVTALTDHLNESHMDYFFNNINIIAERATVILYIDPSAGVKTKYLYNMACSKLKNARGYQIGRYTDQQLGQMVYQELQDMELEMTEDKNLFIKEIIRLMPKYEVALAADTRKMAEDLVKGADYSSISPRLTLSMLKSLR